MTQPVARRQAPAGRARLASGSRLRLRGGLSAFARLRALPFARASAVSERSLRRALPASGRRAGSSDERARDRALQSASGRSGRTRASGGAPAWIRRDVSLGPPFPERMRAGERLPEHHADRPDVGGGGRLLAEQPLGRDVAERAGDVADRGQRVELGHLREPEVEQPHVDLVALGEQHVRRLDVAVDDPAPVRVRERLEHLRGDLDRAAVVELAGRERLAQRLARDVLVGDVDVARVARERVDPLAARMAQRGRGPRLALGARGGLSLARDDLQRDVEAGLLVARKPDVAHSARSERPQRPVAAEDQLLRCGATDGHPRLLRRAQEKSFAPNR